MNTKRAKSTLNIRIKQSQETSLTEEEVKCRLADLFVLLWEIDQESNVTKEYLYADQ